MFYKIAFLVLEIYLLEFAVSVPHDITLKNNRGSKAFFDNEEVFLTLSSEAAYEGSGENVNLLDRRLELNWNNFNAESGDFVGLYNREVSQNNFSADDALEKVSVTTGRGYFRTSWKFQRNDNLSATTGEQCVGYWIAYGRIESNGATTLLKANCLRIYPTWMTDMRDIIGNTPLHSLMIPGTHDAGAWRHYRGLPSENLIIRYYICQEESIYDQLVHGIRYLDVRVAHYPETAEKFWVNHGTFRVDPLFDLISDVQRFTMETNEIVFMDFHGFPVGFSSNSIHEELVQYVEALIGSLLVPKSFTRNVTPNQLWAAGKTVILTYAEDAISSQHDLLWPYLVHAWGDKNDVQDLENYLGETIPARGCSGIFWSAMAEMTPTAEDIIFKPNLGLRGFAQLVNINMTYWYHRESWYSKSMIVSTDFFLGNNIIEMAVMANRNRLVCQR